jgi:hypothetical protein
MAKVKIQGNASGTGVLTITAPNTSTDRTITLPDATGTLIADNGSGNVGIGDTTPTNAKLSIDNVLSGDAGLAIKQDQAYYGIDINQDGNGMAFHIDTAATTQPAIEVEANALTTGKGMLINSNSADTSTRQLLRVTNDHASATGTTLLYADNDSTGLVADFHGTGGIRSRYGIKFGTDTAAANALDDYEEGTWTVAFHGASVSGGNRTGYYTKIGSLVHATVYVSTSFSSVSGQASLSGLPYSMANLSNHYSVGSYVHGTAATNVQNFYMDYTNSRLYPIATNSTGTVSWGSGTQSLMISVTYRAA